MKSLLLLVSVLLLFTACDLSGGLASLSENEVSLPFFSSEKTMEVPSAGDTEPAPTETDNASLPIPETSRPVTTAPQVLSLLVMTDTVERGEMASVTVQGLPGATYQITVHYPSSVSTAAGLEPKVADDNGEITWTWRVGSRTTVGTHSIVIEGNGESLTLTFTVVS